MSPAPSPRRRSRLRLTIGRKAGAPFLLLALLFVGLAAVGTRQLSAVSLDAKRFLEESREDRLTHRVLSGIEQLQLLAQMDTSSLGPATTQGLLSSVTRTLDQLDPRRRQEADPSTREHARAEKALHSEIREGLAALRRQHEAGGRLSPETLWQLQDAVSSVSRETDEAVQAAALDLERRVADLVRIMVGTALAAVAILVALHALTRRHVVRPVEALRQGARTFGSGDLSHRIRIDSSDEVGELAAEFNRMADSLTETQRDLERRVRDRTSELIRTARLADLGTFAAGVAHEVNTPLASIASCAEGLERRIRARTATPDEQVEDLQTIAHEAYRARDITSRLLALARQEAGPTSPLDVRTSIRHVARLFEHEMRRRALRLEVEIPAESRLVQANAMEMEQMLLNLVKNAADASPSGGCVRIGCHARAEHLVLEVEDEGPGIAEADREAIFEPFFTTKRPGEGTGLGLSLVHRIVEGHGGSIDVTSGRAGGALFRVVLPALPADSGEAA